MALFDIYMLVHLKRVDYLTLTSGSKKLIEEDQLIVQKRIIIFLQLVNENV